MPTDHFANSRLKPWLLLLFVAYYCIGVIFAVNSPGSWDELNSRNYGIAGIDHARLYFEEGGIRKPKIGMEHGSSHEILFHGVEKLSGLNPETELREILKLRHVAIFTLFFFGVVAFFLLCRHLFSSPMLALLGVIFLVFHPRIFSHSFYNSYDISFLSACIIAVYCIYIMAHEKSYLWIFLAAVSTAFAVGIRLPGIMLAGFGLYALVAQILIMGNRSGSALLRCLVFIAMTGFFTILFWPFLWGYPVDNFKFAFDGMSGLKFSSGLIYWGEFLKSDNVPWHYNFSYFLVTTPVIILAPVLFGHLVVLGKVCGSGKRFFDNWMLHIILGWVWVPLGLAILLHSTLFDSWRHHYFIYPGLVLIGLYGVRAIQQRFFGKIRAFGAWPAVFASLLIWPLVSLHPYQGIYLNFIPTLFPEAQNSVGNPFDIDYWGLTYKEGLEFIAKSSDDAVVVVRMDKPAYTNWILLDDEFRQKITRVKSGDCDYHMSNYKKVGAEPPKWIDNEEVYSRSYKSYQVLTVRKCGS